MPILNVEIVGEEQDFPQNLAQQIADAAGEVLAIQTAGDMGETVLSVSAKLR